MSKHAISSGLSGMWLTDGPRGGFIWNSNAAKRKLFDSTEAATEYGRLVLVNPESKWEVVPIDEPAAEASA